MRDPSVAALLLFPVALALIASSVLLVAEADDVAEDDDIAAAAAFAATVVGDDDAIVVLPPWSMRPWAALGPVAARVTGGDGPAPDLLPGRYRRVVAIIEPDAIAWMPTLRGLGTPLQTQRFGVVDVAVYDGAGPARFDLPAQLEQAAIDVDGHACTTPLLRGAVSGLACSGHDAAVRVTREHALVTENGRLVVRAPAPARGARLALRFADVPLGEQLIVAAGHTRVGAERGRPVVVDVVVDDVILASLVRTPSFVVEPSRARWRGTFVRLPDEGGEGFRVDVVDTRRFAGTRHRLAFVVRSPGAHDDTPEREFALDAFIPGQEGAR